jgi:hypothetical protein
MTVTEFHSEVQHWRTGEVIRLSWGYDGKVVKAILLAKSGARYVPPQPPDDPLLEFLMEHFGMKRAAARIMARKLPKGTEEERVRAAYGLYEKEARG